MKNSASEKKLNQDRFRYSRNRLDIEGIVLVTSISRKFFAQFWGLISWLLILIEIPNIEWAKAAPPSPPVVTPLDVFLYCSCKLPFHLNVDYVDWKIEKLHSLLYLCTCAYVRHTRKCMYSVWHLVLQILREIFRFTFLWN